MYIIPRSHYTPFRSQSTQQQAKCVKLADVVAKAIKQVKAAFKQNTQKASGKPQSKQINRLWRSK